MGQAKIYCTQYYKLRGTTKIKECMWGSNEGNNKFLSTTEKLRGISICPLSCALFFLLASSACKVVCVYGISWK